MRYQAILFDMDGTLVPMDEHAFVKVYFGELCKALCPLGVDPDTMVKAVWAGTEAMMKNDGSRQNKEVFWHTFARVTGQDPARFQPVADRFYTGSFHNARAATSPNPLAVEAVRIAHEKADHVALATNPLFPMDGQHARMSWVGLAPQDFEIITSYETDRFCKPNSAYYAHVCQRLGVDPQRCLMIGNNDGEDAQPAASLGMDVYLVTDCRIQPDPHNSWTGRQGTFAEMVEWLRAL